MAPGKDQCVPRPEECVEDLTLLKAEQSSQGRLIRDMHAALLGDDQKPGIVERVRTLEYSERSRRWYMRTAVGAALTAAVAAVVNFFSGR